MSRLRNTARSLASGYAAMAAMALYTLASVPLALHYLTKTEFGVWALATQIGSYLLLIDLGMSGSVSRILIDHKDTKGDGVYGAVVQTGGLVLLVQGVLIAVGGILLSLCLPSLMEVEPGYTSIFRVLTAGQCVLLGLFFVGRLFTHVLQAHQRYDIINYSQIAQLIVNYAVQWLTFHRGMGLYSLLVASAAGSLVGTIVAAWPTMSLGLLPPRGKWGKPSYRTFRQLFAFGGDLFLLSIGYQLLNASQVIIVSRTLGKFGLDLAAVWVIATRTFTLVQQVVGRIFDFSTSALGEMFVRGERETLQRTFRNLLILTTSAAVFVGLSVAVNNGSFLTVWTKGKISWAPGNDAMLGVLLILTTMMRCHIGLLGVTKEIGGMRYVYFLEGISFVVASFAMARWIGMPGIIASAIVSNIAWSGSYGLRRTARYFGVTAGEIMFQWLGPSIGYFLALSPISAALWFGTLTLPALPRLLVGSAAMSIIGLPLFWRIGLPETTRQELRAAATRLLRRKVLA